MQIHQTRLENEALCRTLSRRQNRTSSNPHWDELVTVYISRAFYRQALAQCFGRLGRLVSVTLIRRRIKTNNCSIYRFNLLSHLTASQVCLASNTTKAAKVIDHLIQVAMECCASGNWNSAMAIALGLNLTPVARLTKTWSKVKSEKLFVLKVSVWRPQEMI